MSNWKDLKNNPRLKEIYDRKIKIHRLVREFFWSQGFEETETPVALKYPGQEPYLNPVGVEFFDPSGRREKFYLQTSPEFALKKLLAVGYPKIFELAKSFRNQEEWGGNHNTEFTMLEFYRAPGELNDIMDDLENLFKFIFSKIGGDKILACSGDKIWERISMKELWLRELDINLDDNLNLEQLAKTAEKSGFSVDSKDSYEDIFFQIFLDKIESKLGKDKPVFVYDYPAQMCSLSKTCSHDSRYAERFELYINGLELANGFGELTDGKKQKELLEEDKRKRQILGREIYAVDPDFLAALDEIKVPAAGVALGVDRMVLLFSPASNLNEVIFESVANQLEF